MVVNRLNKKPVTALTHVDATTEAWLDRIMRGAANQAVGRGRGVKRQESTPLNVWILSEEPINQPIDELFPAAFVTEGDPYEQMEAVDGIVLNNPHMRA